MKHRLLILSILCAIMGFVPAFANNNQLDSLLNVLDRTIKNHQIYKDQREQRIKRLKIQLTKALPQSKERYLINEKLYEEYKPYSCDSAIAYLDNNIELATAVSNISWIIDSKLKLSYLLASSGMYMESIDLLNGIDKKKIPATLRLQYYMCYDHAYGEMGCYSQDRLSKVKYEKISQNYKNLIYQLLPKNTEEYRQMQETSARDCKDYKQAMKINNERLAQAQMGTPTYALVMYHRSLIYNLERNSREEMSCLALSSISDIQSAIMDHASLWTLAKLLYDNGDIERAYTYMRFSWNETKLYNARLRNIQSAGILSLIDATFQSMIEKKNHKLQLNLILISFLFVALALAFIYIGIQFRKLSAAKNALQQVNFKLQSLNDELKSTNDDLSESNHIKEEYIGRFLNLCSTYIDKLNAYRKMVNKMVTMKRTDELYNMTRSSEGLNKELDQLYATFDSAFLHLFPDFVEQINDLLEEEGKLIPKKGELLNTELRIFALIRLGIDNSSQIAEFLRYSANTIYNYRAKVKNSAKVERSTFEDAIKRIR